MRLLGVREISCGWHFEATRDHRIHNGAADRMSCLDRSSVFTIFTPFVPKFGGRFENWEPSAFLSVLRGLPRPDPTHHCGLE